MTVVVDASVVAAALVDSGPMGTWAESVLLDGPLAAVALPPGLAIRLWRSSNSARSARMPGPPISETRHHSVKSPDAQSTSRPTRRGRSI